MTRYLLSLYQPDGPPPPDLDLEAVMKEVDVLVEETKSEGVWVFNGGLHPADTATVVTARDEEVLVTDGPYLEGKEHVGGFIIVEVEDLDAALEWGQDGAGRAAARGGATVPARGRLIEGEAGDRH